jgi:ribonuclease HI
MKIEIYCDGAYSRKLNCGSYAALFFKNGSKEPFKRKSAIHTNSSSNQCELHGLITSLETCLEEKWSYVAIYSDSQYCVKSYNGWMEKWKNKGWKKGNRDPVMNLELMKRLYDLKTYIRRTNQLVSVIWIRGHNGDHRNDLADAAAKELIYG